MGNEQPCISLVGALVLPDEWHYPFNSFFGKRALYQGISHRLLGKI